MEITACPDCGRDVPVLSVEVHGRQVVTFAVCTEDGEFRHVDG